MSLDVCSHTVRESCDIARSCRQSPDSTIVSRNYASITNAIVVIIASCSNLLASRKAARSRVFEIFCIFLSVMNPQCPQFDTDAQTIRLPTLPIYECILTHTVVPRQIVANHWWIQRGCRSSLILYSQWASYKHLKICNVDSHGNYVLEKCGPWKKN